MDRLSELQMVVDDMGTQFFETIGRIQRDAPPAPLDSDIPFPLANTLDDEAIEALAAKLVQTGKLVNEYIDSLPWIESTEAQQLETLEQLEKENRELGLQLEIKTREAQTLLDHVEKALDSIANDRLACQFKKKF
eukprot:TRINITY_DN342_c0_g1_i1.p1 TRINITY_DN342_c0_g1~~TRINITY_DN342_c0_g1_i1.p1  ORF type:complete len:147 (+),score=37.16 TRINITY_DN342_c0_g1_i1:39-443(+)